MLASFVQGELREVADRMKMRVLGLLVVGLALAGCEKNTVRLAPGAEALQTANPAQVGYLVGSIGRMPVGSYPAYEFSICDKNHAKIATLQYKTGLGGMEAKQIDESDYFGDSFAVALPAGDYEICDSFTKNWQMPAQYYQNGTYIPPMGGGGWRPGQPISIPLKIEAGKLNYIGRYKAVLIKGYVLGLPTANGAFWVVTDHQAADLPYVLQKNAPLTNLPAVSAVPPKDKLPAPLFFPALPPDYKGW